MHQRTPDSRTIWTIGHSNHSIDHFISMLSASSISLVADVRRFPGSRRQPQFARENLAQALAAAGIKYQHFPDLGGRRTSRAPNSPNMAWRVESFNVYADHMLTPQFQAALVELEHLATAKATTIMCAEAVPWRCHRRLIADALVARKWSVLDIYDINKVKEHQFTEFAHVENGLVTYPGLLSGE